MVDGKGQEETVTGKDFKFSFYKKVSWGALVPQIMPLGCLHGLCSLACPWHLNNQQCTLSLVASAA
jgi:hypothetical protein